MQNARYLFQGLRQAAISLLLLAVFLGPAGLGASSGSALAQRACGESCPCEDEANGHEGDAEVHEEEAPCEDECPEDCPRCECCLGVAMAMMPLAAPATELPTASVHLLAPPTAPPSGALTGVFRPPRSAS